jgi:hypothetical protein
MEIKNELDKLFYSVYVKLGGTNIEVELEQDDYNVAFDEALRTYRTYSRESIHEGFLFLEAKAGEMAYQLPEEIDSVKEIRRLRTALLMGGNGFEPFSAAFIQHTLRYRDTTFPGLLNFEALTQFQEQIGRMFGEHIMFEFDEGEGKLHLWRTLRGDETVMLECSAVKSIDRLLKNSAAYKWLMQYTEAGVRMILGEKYSKLATIPGPQGGTVLKGSDLIATGKEMKEQLIQDLLDSTDGGGGPIPFFG